MGVATIGSALVEKRLELGLDKGQAAEVIGMSRTTYSSYEQDSQRPSVDVFPALAEFLGISTEMLLTLYGATCIAAIRPSLERVASHQGASGEAAVSSEPLQSIVDEPSRDSASPSEEVTSESESASTESVVNYEVVESEEVRESPELLDYGTDESPPDIEVDEGVSVDADENVSPDAEVDESVSREREVSAEDLAIVTPIVSESYPQPTAYTSKKKSASKKKKKKKQKNR
jgi:transcriptional regulator with XRE-family HTH domain